MHGPNVDNQHSSPIRYQIRLEGELSDQWASWFENFTMQVTPQGETYLTGTVTDQAALHGLLRRIRDLGIPLIAVVRLPADE